MTRWPALMLRKTVAEYMDMSEDSVIKEVSAGRLPAPFKIGGRDHWRRDAIDAAIARLTGSSDMPEWEKEFYERYGPEAA